MLSLPKLKERTRVLEMARNTKRSLDELPNSAKATMRNARPFADQLFVVVVLSLLAGVDALLNLK